MFKRIFAIAALAALPFAANANTINIGFDTGVASFAGAQQLVGYSQEGFTFGISQTRTSGADATHANLYDSTNPIPDDDLVPNDGPNGIFGNVLIRQNAGTTGRPNDAAGNGFIEMTFTGGTAFRLLGFSAIDDGVFSVSVGGNVLATLDPGADSATAAASFVSPLINVGDVIRIDYTGSGAVDSFIIAPVPLPAGGLLLLAGLGGLAIARRRNQKA